MSPDIISAAIVLALLVLGNAVSARVAVLRTLNIPGSFVGGIVGSVLVLLLQRTGLFQFTVPEVVRDLLLVGFFVSAGLGTTLASWFAAGRPLLTLSVLCTLLMACQNVIGILVTTSMGMPAAYGVLTGSVALAGGLGSAVAWGNEFGAIGVPRATEVAVMAATVGMVIGTFIGGPYVSWVIRKKRLAVPHGTSDERADLPQAPVLLIEKHLIIVLFLFALSIVIGDVAREFLRAYGWIVPRFLTAMLAGLALSALADVRRIEIHRPLVERCGELCLSLFIVIALAQIDLSALAKVAGPLAIVAFAQTVATVLFAHLVVFRAMGKDFEAAATSGSVIGFALSSFAVAMATVKQVARNYGPAPKSVLLTALVGGAVSNVANALVIMAFYQWFASA